MDCTQLSEQLVRFSIALAAKENLQTFDEVLVRVQQELGEMITRDVLSDAFLEMRNRRRKPLTEIQKVLRNIYRTPILEEAAKLRAQHIESYLESGKWPYPRPARMKVVSFELDKLRATARNLRRWLQTTDPAQRERLEKKAADLSEKLLYQELDPKQTGKYHEELQDILSEIESLRSRIRKERESARLAKIIETLQKHLEEETLPEKKEKKTESDPAMEQMRQLIRDLRVQILRSAPAVQKRLETQIKALQETLRLIAEEGIFPEKPSRKEAAINEEILRLQYEKGRLQKRIRMEIESLEPITPLEKLLRLSDIFRLLITSGEFSFLLRQGGIYFFTHPARWARTVFRSAPALLSEENLYRINKELLDGPLAPLMRRAGLALMDEGTRLSSQEEIIMNYWQDKIPVIRNINRFAVAFINQMRTDMFQLGYQTLGKDHTLTREESQVWANYINVITGRGNLGTLERISYPLNRMFFSPRYVVSRFQYVLAYPLWKGFKHKSLRNLIIQEYIRLGLGLSSFLLLASFAGIEIEPDPRSSDFGKLRSGRMRLDTMMGFGQVIRLMSRLISGSTKTAAGQILPIRGPKKPPFGADTEEILMDFLRSKLSPQFGIMMNLLTGETMMGEEIDMLNQIGMLTIPITYKDIYEAMKEDNIPEALIFSALSFLGMGLQVYNPPETEINVSF